MKKKIFLNIEGDYSSDGPGVAFTSAVASVCTVIINNSVSLISKRISLSCETAEVEWVGGIKWVFFHFVNIFPK